MEETTIVQYGNFRVNQKELDTIQLQLYLYIIAAINHNLNIESYVDLYGKEYATNIQPNITDATTLSGYIDAKKPVPFYAQSNVNSLGFIADSLNMKNQGENLMTLMLLVDNYEAEFNYMELELDSNMVITKAYDCKSSITYEEVSNKPDVIDIQTIFKNKYKKEIKLKSLEILI